MSIYYVNVFQLHDVFMASVIFQLMEEFSLVSLGRETIRSDQDSRHWAECIQQRFSKLTLCSSERTSICPNKLLCAAIWTTLFSVEVTFLWMTVLPRVFNFCFFKGEWNGTAFSTSLVWTKSLKASFPNSSTLRSEVHYLWLGVPLLQMKTIQSISALNVKRMNEISKSLVQFCDVLLTLLYLGWPEVLYEWSHQSCPYLPFQECKPCDTPSMVCWNISAEANNPSCTFTWRLIVCSMIMSTRLHDPGTFDQLTLSPPFLRVSSAPGWATRFRREVIYKKVPGIVVMIHHKVTRTHFLQAWDVEIKIIFFRYTLLL